MLHTIQKPLTGHRSYVWPIHNRILMFVTMAAISLLIPAYFLSFLQTLLPLWGHNPLWYLPAGYFIIPLHTLLYALRGRKLHSCYAAFALSFGVIALYNLVLSMTRMGYITSLFLSVVEILTLVTMLALRIFALKRYAGKISHPSLKIQSYLAIFSVSAYVALYFSAIPAALLLPVEAAMRLQPLIGLINKIAYYFQCLHILQLAVHALSDLFCGLTVWHSHRHSGGLL